MMENVKQNVIYSYVILHVHVHVLNCFNLRNFGMYVKTPSRDDTGGWGGDALREIPGVRSRAGDTPSRDDTGGWGGDALREIPGGRYPIT